MTTTWVSIIFKNSFSHWWTFGLLPYSFHNELCKTLRELVQKLLYQNTWECLFQIIFQSCCSTLYFLWYKNFYWIKFSVTFGLNRFLHCFMVLTSIWGAPGGASGKEPSCQCRRCKRHRFDPWVRKIPWRKAWKSTPVFLLGESHGHRSPVSYISWGRKESVTTEAT